MVEGGRLEIVLAVLNCHVGSNPTLSANNLNKQLIVFYIGNRSITADYLKHILDNLIGLCQMLFLIDASTS